MKIMFSEEDIPKEAEVVQEEEVTEIIADEPTTEKTE